MKKTRYEVIVVESRRRCGHKHRVKRAAEKCRKKLLFGGFYALATHRNLHNAEWHNAVIREVGE